MEDHSQLICSRRGWFSAMVINYISACNVLFLLWSRCCTLQFIILMAVLVIAQAVMEFCVLRYSSSSWWPYWSLHKQLWSFVVYVTVHHLDGRTGHCTSCCGVLCFVLQFIILMVALYWSLHKLLWNFVFCVTVHHLDGRTGAVAEFCVLCYTSSSSWPYWSLHKLLWSFVFYVTVHHLNGPYWL